MQDLAQLVGASLFALQQRGKQPRPFSFLSGWRPLSYDELPSLGEIGRMHEGYGPVTAAQLAALIAPFAESRGLPDTCNEHLIAAAFDMCSGSYLITFEITGERRVRGYLDGGVRAQDCSMLTMALERRFEWALLPMISHAAEMLHL